MTLEKGCLADRRVKRGSLVAAERCLEAVCGLTQSRSWTFLSSPSCVSPGKSRNHSEPLSPPLEPGNNTHLLGRASVLTVVYVSIVDAQ